MSDGVVPPDGLYDYAHARGLDHRGQAAQIGYLAAFGMSEELQFNVLRGMLPGGERGLLFHDVRIIEGGMTYGLDHATQIGGTPRRRGMRPRLRDFVPMADVFDTTALYKSPATTVAIRLPEASGLVVGLNAAREPERGALRSGQWREVAGGPRGWQVGARTRGDAAAIDAVVRGPLTELLAQTQPVGFEVWLRFGTLTVSQTHFATDPAKLDALCEKASRLAAGVRAVCERHARPLEHAVELPEPFWLADVLSKPAGDTFVGGDGQNLGAVLALARETRMELEDAFAFMRAFPYLAVPGEAFGVLRGTLPGTDVAGRVVVGLERRGIENKPLAKALEHPVGGPFGCDTVIAPVAAGLPDTPGIDGEQWIERGRVAIRRGLLVAWRPRAWMSPQRHEVESLALDALAAVRERGATW